MAIAAKDMSAADSTIVFDISEETFGNSFAFQYPTGGGGTLVVEATMDEVTWEDLGFYKSDDATQAIVLTAAAAGLYIGEIPPCKKLRLRKSVGADAITPYFAVGATW